MKPIVQISLDVTTIEEAIETAEMAVRAGVDWLEAGTPLILAEGLRCVRELHARFPEIPIVADLKTMDGGYLEAEMMAKAGASFVVVMARPTRKRSRWFARRARIMESASWVITWAARTWWQGPGSCRIWAATSSSITSATTSGGASARGQQPPTPLDQLSEVVAAVDIPVQAVGGMSIDQAIESPSLGAPLVVIGHRWRSIRTALKGRAVIWKQSSNRSVNRFTPMETFPFAAHSLVCGPSGQRPGQWPARPGQSRVQRVLKIRSPASPSPGTIKLR